MKTIEGMLKKLPPQLQQEVWDFVEFLITKKGQKYNRQKYGMKLRQDWAGGLKDFRNQYTSLELQKKALEWRGD